MPASRQFSLTIPADNNFHNLYTLMLGVTGAVPTDGILAKSVSHINIINNDPATTMNIADSNFAHNTGDPVAAGTNWFREANRNSFYLPDFNVQGTSVPFSIDISSF